MTALARATAMLVVALVLAMAATAYWLDRRGVKRTKLAAAAIELKLERTRTSVLQLSNEIAAERSSIAELRNEIAGLRATTGGAMQPTSIVLGPADTYDELDHNWKSIGDASGRAAVPCTDGGPLRPLVIVTLGQSNAANSGRGLYAPKHRVDNFNLYDGKCYKAVEPLLGPTGQGGNFATRLADMLIERRLADASSSTDRHGGTCRAWAHRGSQSAHHVDPSCTMPVSRRTTSFGTRAKATPAPATSVGGNIARICSRSSPVSAPTASMHHSLWPW